MQSAAPCLVVEDAMRCVSEYACLAVKDVWSPHYSGCVCNNNSLLCCFCFIELAWAPVKKHQLSPCREASAVTVLHDIGASRSHQYTSAHRQLYSLYSGYVRCLYRRSSVPFVISSYVVTSYNTLGCQCSCMLYQQSAKRTWSHTLCSRWCKAQSYLYTCTFARSSCLRGPHKLSQTVALVCFKYIEILQAWHLPQAECPLCHAAKPAVSWRQSSTQRQ